MTEKEHKRGALSNEDKKYILDNIGILEIDEIAKNINRNPTPVKKFVLKNRSKIQTNKKIEVFDNSDDYLKKRLYTEFFWPATKIQLNKQEQDYFVAQWVEFVKQFNEDVMPTEKQEIKALIINEIYKIRAGVELKENYDAIKRYEKKIEREENGARDQAKIDVWTGQIYAIKGLITALILQIEKFTKVSGDLTKSLKGTRDQRYKSVENSHTTFSQIVKDLANREELERQNREMGLLDMATDKAVKALYKVHDYIDGTQDQPFLNADSVEYLEKLRELEDKEKKNASEKEEN